MGWIYLGNIKFKISRISKVDSLFIRQLKYGICILEFESGLENGILESSAEGTKYLQQKYKGSQDQNLV